MTFCLSSCSKEEDDDNPIIGTDPAPSYTVVGSTSDVSHADFKAETKDGKILYFIVTSPSTCKVTYKSSSNNSDYVIGSLSIPSIVAYQGEKLDVNEIDNNAFRGCKNLGDVALPKTITVIGSYSFADCTSLTSINLPNNVDKIGERTFNAAKSLEKIVYNNKEYTVKNEILEILSKKGIIQNDIFVGTLLFDFNVEKEKIEISSDYQVIKLKITSSGNWDAVSSSSWMSTSSSTDDAEIVSIYISQNQSDNARSGVIELKSLQKDFSIKVEVLQNGGYNGHGYIDLGLSSGTLWATCNIGANSAVEDGGYYAWGETHELYVLWHTNGNPGSLSSNYSYYNKSGLTKYCTNSKDGIVDNKTVLEPTDDAATVNWGGKWRMPTKEEFEELLNGCSWAWENKGVLLTSRKNGNTLFLPAAGYSHYLVYYYDYKWSTENGSKAYYWTSSLHNEFSDCAYYFDGFNIERNARYYGLPIRPVFSR